MHEQLAAITYCVYTPPRLPFWGSHLPVEVAESLRTCDDRFVVLLFTVLTSPRTIFTNMSTACMAAPRNTIDLHAYYHTISGSQHPPEPKSGQGKPNFSRPRGENEAEKIEVPEIAGIATTPVQGLVRGGLRRPHTKFRGLTIIGFPGRYQKPYGKLGRTQPRMGMTFQCSDSETFLLPLCRRILCAMISLLEHDDVIVNTRIRVMTSSLASHIMQSKRCHALVLMSEHKLQCYSDGVMCLCPL